MSPTVTASEEGKPVIDANDEQIATVERLEEGTALVDPDSEISPATTRALGWTDEDDLVPLREQCIDRITDQAVHLESNL